MYKNVIFDFDGTLMNTFPGIYNSFEYAFANMGLLFPGKDFVKKTIGISLERVFENQLGFNKKESNRAIQLFRDYYEKKGKYEASLYEGIPETLNLLIRKKYPLGIATLKREKYAKEMLQFQKCAHYFTVIHGMDERFSSSKESLIQKCLVDLNADKKDTILIGDGMSDFLAARNIGIGFMAVTYGFGLCNEILDALDPKDISYIAHTGYEIGELLDSTI